MIADIFSGDDDFLQNLKDERQHGNQDIFYGSIYLSAWSIIFVKGSSQTKFQSHEMKMYLEY